MAKGALAWLPEAHKLRELLPHGIDAAKVSIAIFFDLTLKNR